MDLAARKPPAPFRCCVRQAATLLRRVPAVARTLESSSRWNSRSTRARWRCIALRAPLGIATGDSREDRRVVARASSRRACAYGSVLRAPPDLARAGPTARRRRARAMPLPVALARPTWNSRSAASRAAKSSTLRRHSPDASRSEAMIGRRRVARRQRGDFALDQLARRKELERAGAAIGIVADAAGATGPGLRGHEDAGADAHFDEAGDFERDDRLAHRGARNAEQARELALSGQPRARRELAVVDQRGDLAGDLPVEPRRLDGMQRHGIHPLMRACRLHGARSSAHLAARRAIV